MAEIALEGDCVRTLRAALGAPRRPSERRTSRRPRAARGGGIAKLAPRHREGRDAPRQNPRCPPRRQPPQYRAAPAPARCGMQRRTMDHRHSCFACCLNDLEAKTNRPRQLPGNGASFQYCCRSASVMRSRRRSASSKTTALTAAEFGLGRLRPARRPTPIASRVFPG